jgi:hypothetical protein
VVDGENKLLDINHINCPEKYSNDAVISFDNCGCNDLGPEMVDETVSS